MVRHLIAKLATVTQRRATAARPRPIAEAGSYGAGDYFLADDIAVSDGDGLVFTATARLDLRGHTISSSRTGDAWDCGVHMAGEGSRLFDSSGGIGGITGFRVGAKFSGAGSKAVGVDFAGNRYIGVSVDADEVEVRGGHVADIGGVSDEKYAIGVQVGTAARCLIDGVTVRNIYPQAAYAGDAAGDGVAINLSANAVACTVRNCTVINDVARTDTFGVFGGPGGDHAVLDSRFRNFWRGIAMANIGSPTVAGNVVETDTPHNDDLGIGCAGGAVADNLVVGYHVSFDPGTDTSTSIAVARSEPTVGPRPRATSAVPPPVAGVGAVLAESLDGSFGNIEGRVVKVRIKASALAKPARMPKNLRLKLVGTQREPLSIDGLYIGPKDEDGEDWDAGFLAKLTVAGMEAFVIPTGGEVWTDWLAFRWDKASDLIVSFKCAGDAAHDNLSARTHTVHDTYLNNGGDAAGLAHAKEFGTYRGYLSGIAEIEMDGF